MQSIGAIHDVGFTLCRFPFTVLLVEVLSMIFRVVSCGPFSLTMVTFLTPLELSTFHCLFEDGCFTLVTIGFVAFSWTEVSPTLALLQPVLPVVVCLTIELLLDIVLALESFVIAGSVRLYLS